MPSAEGEIGSQDTEDAEVTDKEESLAYDDRASRDLRLDIARASLRDIAGRDINWNIDVGLEKQAGGPVSVANLERGASVHVTTPSDAQLWNRVSADKVVFLRGVISTGRRASATVVLDRLTGMDRKVSKVTLLDAASGLAALPERLKPGHGHLVDASGQKWVNDVTEAQIAGARETLGADGFLIILVDADTIRSLPTVVVDHEMPDIAEVVVFQLAAMLATDFAPDTAAARALIDEACRTDDATARWHEESTRTAKTGTAEAAQLATMICTWHEQRAADPGARPRAAEFRNQHRYQLAASLLRPGDGMDSPLRQSYAIAAAVLDGLTLSEVIEGAATLGTLLAEVEHPGEPGHREIFAQPLTRWLPHVELAAATTDSGDGDGTVVRMPSRGLSWIVIEVAWRSYDAARSPLLEWLMKLCLEHPDERVRIRAVHALAVIARYDYALVRHQVLDQWSKSRRFAHHQSAAWLLEAMVLQKTAVSKVKALVSQWSTSGDTHKRAIAVRAYGTAVASEAPLDAIRGVRFSGPDRWMRVLPELALYEMYTRGLFRQVMTELVLWMRGFPLMRERSGAALIRISRILPIDDEAVGGYDLLRRLAHAPGELGVDIAEVAALWHMACRHERSRSNAWQMIGRWAESCHHYPELRGTFTRLADELQFALGDGELIARLGVYRRRWSV